MSNKDFDKQDRQEVERYAQTLVDQTNRLILKLGIEVPDVESSSKYSLTFRQVAKAYERLALAEKRTTPVALRPKD